MRRLVQWFFVFNMFVFLLFGGGCRSQPGQKFASSLTILALGDSITLGVRPGVSEEFRFTSILQDLYQESDVEVHIINLGKNEEQTGQALQRFDGKLLNIKADFVLILYGTYDAFFDQGANSSRVPIEKYTQNLTELIARIRASSALPVLITPTPMGEMCLAHEYEPYASSGINFNLAAYAEVCRQIASKEDIPCVDLFQSWTVLAQNGTDIDRWLTDGMFPNPEGHGLIAKAVFTRLKEKIKTLNSKDLPVQSPEYSIPTLDISGQKTRQVIVDREPGQYLGHPTTVLLEDSRSMLTVYPKGHGRGAIVLKNSGDAGLTWSSRLPTPENWATSLEVPTLHRVIDPQGKKRLILFSGLYPIRMAVSEDDGTNWTPLKPIGDFGGIVAMGCVERLKNGEYIAMFHDDGRFIRKDGARTGVFEVYKTLSGDGGLTWSTPEAILSGSRVHLCEPGIVRSPDGDQLAVLLRENSRTRNSYVIFSNDEGLTWTEPRELPASLTGDRHTGRYAPDGRLFISFRDRTHISPTWGDWVAWVGTYEDILYGREGQYRVRIMDNTRGADCAYPGVEVLADGTFVTTTYGHWIQDQEPFVVCVRIKLEDLDRIADMN